MWPDNDSTNKVFGLPPLMCEAPKILILGSLPGGASLAHRQYYYSNSNRIWKVLCHITGEPMPLDYAQKKSLLAKYHIALWDYYESAVRTGSKDKCLKDGRPNDLSGLLEKTPSIKLIGINGFGKFDKFGKKIQRNLACMPGLSDVRILRLPDTSGSNANHGWGNLENLARAWEIIFD